MITKWRGQLLAKTILAGFSSIGVPTALVAGTAILAPNAVAQETSVTFYGRVITDAGAPVAGGAVTLTSDQGLERSITTDASGRFLVPALQAGSYGVKISAPGYSSLVDSGVPLRTGSSSFTYTLTRSSSAETVIVTGQRVANLDFNNTATGIVINTTELSTRIPLGTDVADLMLLAPGSVPGDESFSGAGSNYGRVTSISGASIAENAFYINGLNVTNHRTLIGGSRVPFEMYDTVEVRTGGYQAEYGRATGGIINATTKSGSNDFHYGYIGSFSPDFFNEDTAPNTYQAKNEFDERETWSNAFYASGPIIKDRLFFYGIYEAQSDIRTDTSETNSSALLPANRRPNMGIRQKQTDESPTYGGKLDWIINDLHRIEYTYINDENETEVSKDRVDESGAPTEHRGDFTFGGGGITQVAKYTGDFTDWMTLSLSYGKNEQSDFIRAAPNPNLAMIDTTPGFTIETGRPWNALTVQEADDSREVWRADADFRFDLIGSHHVRIGYDDTTLETQQSTTRNGPCTPIVAPVTALASSPSSFNGQCLNVFLQRNSNLTTGAGGPYTAGRYRYDYYSNIGGFTSDQKAMYLQDSWDILPNLTLQLGVRADSYSNQNLNGQTFVEVEDQIAPRVGFAWDPGDDGLSKVYGSFGTYYLPVATNTNVRLGGSEFFSRINYRATGPAQYPAVGYDGYPTGFTYAGTTNFSVGTVPTLQQARSENLEPFQEDEYVLGYERVFGDWTLGLNYTHRELVEVIEDIAIDSAVVAYCRAQGGSCSSTFSGTHQYVLANPGKSVRVQLTDSILGDPAGTLRTLDLSEADLGYPEAERILDQVQFTFERKFDGKWGLQGSYTWIDSRGNYEGAVKSDNAQDDAGLTQDFDLPGLVVGAYGKLPNHREHTLKLFGTYAVTEEFLIGANGYVQSPRQFGCIGVAPGDPTPSAAGETSNPPGDGGYAQLYGASAFYCLDRDPANNGANALKINATPRGTQLESDWTTNLDLSFIWNKELPAAGALQLRFDIFNVFNSDAVTDLNEFGDIANGALFLVGQSGPYASQSPTYGLPLRYQAPRRYQIGASLRF